MSRKDLTIRDTKIRVFNRDGWRCTYRDKSGERCQCTQPLQLAHVLPQDFLHLARYGPSVIHHDDNFKTRCPRHNADAQLSYRSRPLQANEHAERIREAIEEGR